MDLRVAPEAVAEVAADVVAEVAPEAVAEVAPEAVAEVAPKAAVEVQDPRQRRAIRLGALAAAISAAVDRSKQQHNELQVAKSEVAALNDQVTYLASDRVALQANVDEQEQSLTEEEEEIDGLRSDIENLNGQVTELTAESTSCKPTSTQPWLPRRRPRNSSKRPRAHSPSCSNRSTARRSNCVRCCPKTCSHN